ncbi:MAG: transcription-repair coupling factor [Oscillospiraceae bacterium]|jgi:transcription-repair coupling factor (superfamily II helicase)|nr:transcription-repair coupling factor [Oscillospiraceae bacterium]
MSSFSALLQESPELHNILTDIRGHRLPMGVLGLSPVHKAHLIAALCENLPRRALVVLPDEMQAARLRDDLQAFGARAVLYPARDLALRPSESRSREYEHRRLAALDAMSQRRCDILVCSAEAAMQRTVPPEALEQRSFSLTPGDEISIETLTEKLLRAGYARAEQVEGPGQFARRGGILDIFPPQSELPARVEFWDASIDTVASFEPESQRRIEPLNELRVLQANEIVPESTEALLRLAESLIATIRGKGSVKIKQSLQGDIDLLREGMRPNSIDRYLPLIYPRAATVLDYLEPGGLLVFGESFNLKERAQACEKLWHEDFKGYLEEGTLCAGLENFSLRWHALLDEAQHRGVIYMDHLPRGSFDTPVRDLVSLTARQLTPWNGLLRLLLEDVDHLRDRRDFQCVIFAGTEKAAKTLADDLCAEGLPALYCPAPPAAFPKGIFAVLPGTLSAGAEYPLEKVTIITFGAKAAARNRRQEAAGKKHGGAKNAFHSLTELRPGDYVVHKAHGVGIFEGVTGMNAGGAEKDYIQIRYNKGDMLYLPVTQLDQVTKYVGPRDHECVKLNRLGGAEWKKAKSRAAANVKDLAKELTALYAQRLKINGHAFSEDIDMQNDFERRFEFEETADQLRCVDEIKKDMERPYPMDRLLCGDVGFGKTEVALRAAFKCAAEGLQTAILVPTTILAYQHYQTIQRRFEGFPLEAAMLSRFVSPADSRKILARLKRGSLDIIVGTHRLLSKNIEFHQLGLIIVDEEQRFGVAQKERLKERYPHVDVLTLTATPIPRTLNMAMSEIRDMSVLEEAPQDRYPVQTYVLEHDMGVLAQAMHQELRRSGQVYYLHNRVESIDRRAAQIKELLPEATVAVAHGQMDEETLSDIWRRLLEGEVDILVCTTIIETGVDVPNVNTLIIEDADRMGLAQLHQIRGRVGRSARRASAYFTFHPGKELTEIAQHRLEAIREYTEFGSGFQIAMRDLELRGAGSLLGAQQHGHLEAIGYDLYMEMLAEAVAEEKALQEGVAAKVPAASMRDCKIDLPIDAHIPESYIASVNHRLGMYRRMAEIRTQEDAEDVIDELLDRFGEPPEPVLGLIDIALVRAAAAEKGIFEIGLGGERAALYIEALDMPLIQSMAQALPGRVKVSAGSGKPYIAIALRKSETLLQTLKRALLAS